MSHQVLESTADKFSMTMLPDFYIKIHPGYKILDKVLNGMVLICPRDIFCQIILSSDQLCPRRNRSTASLFWDLHFVIEGFLKYINRGNKIPT